VGSGQRGSLTKSAQTTLPGKCAGEAPLVRSGKSIGSATADPRPVSNAVAQIATVVAMRFKELIIECSPRDC
jgi:hypothetical protein